ncbi:MAG: hypothetical protein ACRDHV_04590 [Actinomycetota bacterium]
MNQAEWERLTRWPGSPPTPQKLWQLFNSEGLPDSFREEVGRQAVIAGPLRAGLAQSLDAQGFAGDSLLTKLKESIGRRILASTLARLLTSRVERSQWKVRFANLVSGRFTELVFERAFRSTLEALGLQLIEETSAHTYVDYRIEDGRGFELAVNLKNAGVQYREAARWVGLDPEDTLPMATYKIFGSEVAAIPPLVYVYLVDWTLLKRLREAYWHSALNGDERDAFRLLTSVKGLTRSLEDSFIDCTIRQRLDLLIKEVGYEGRDLIGLPFRTISAGRCRRIFYEHHDRSPYVYRQRMNTDPNVHISVRDETVPFSTFIERYLATSDGRQALLLELDRKETQEVPAPSV